MQFRVIQPIFSTWHDDTTLKQTVNSLATCGKRKAIYLHFADKVNSRFYDDSFMLIKNTDSKCTHETYMKCTEASSQHVIKSNDIRTPSNVLFNILLSFEVFATKTAAKFFDVRVNDLMLSQFSWCTEALLTFFANVRLHTFMSLYVCLKVTFDA